MQSVETVELADLEGTVELECPISSRDPAKTWNLNFASDKYLAIWLRDQRLEMDIWDEPFEYF